MVWGNEGWTTAKEREFEDVCRALAGAYVHFKQAWGLLIDLKATSPLKVKHHFVVFKKILVNYLIRKMIQRDLFIIVVMGVRGLDYLECYSL